MVNLNPYGRSVDPFELFVCIQNRRRCNCHLRKRMPGGGMIHIRIVAEGAVAVQSSEAKLAHKSHGCMVTGSAAVPRETVDLFTRHSRMFTF